MYVIAGSPEVVSRFGRKTEPGQVWMREKPWEKEGLKTRGEKSSSQIPTQQGSKCINDKEWIETSGCKWVGGLHPVTLQVELSIHSILSSYSDHLSSPSYQVMGVKGMFAPTSFTSPYVFFCTPCEEMVEPHIHINLITNHLPSISIYLSMENFLWIWVPILGPLMMLPFFIESVCWI